MAAATGNPVLVIQDGAAASPPTGPLAGAKVTEVPAHRRRRWVRGALAAGIAAVLVAVGLLIPSFISHQNRPVISAEAIGTLNQAALAALGATDAPVGPGQYRYIETHAWWTVFSGYNIFRDENLIQTWVPANPDDPTQDWMLDRRPTGNRV